MHLCYFDLVVIFWMKYNLAGSSLYLIQNIMIWPKYHSCIVLFTIKHNTYSQIESFDGITSIGENLSKTEKYKGTILIKVFIWVTVLLGIFFQVNSITWNFCLEIFFGKANNVIYLQTNCHKKNCKWLLKIFQLWKLFRLALFVRVFQL